MMRFLSLLLLGLCPCFLSVDMWSSLVRLRGERLRGLGLGFTNPGGTWGKWDMCVLVTVVWVV